MNTKTLNGTLFAQMVRAGAANLNRNRVTVNELNVFPIPDGDTGDNMFMTINSGAQTAGTDETPLHEMASRIAKGMLLGARGNSGVILSRIFAGISKGFSDVETADIRALASAFSDGITEAYSAVSVPVEGTILTVYKDAVNYANSRVSKTSTLESYFDDLLPELRRSLDRTPSLLAVLEEAGVVDSGGAGFVYIAEGMQKALAGIEIDGDAPAAETQHQVDLSTFNENSELDYGYCTEFLLQLLNSKVDVTNFDESELIDWLNANGESVVAFREGSILKVHIHTMTPGVILNHVQNYGEFLTLKIENMMLQHNETTIRNNYSPKKLRPHKAYATVSVASGEGMKNTLLSLGTDEVVEGGQSMNPSAEAFVSAFENLNADTILVFPNNGNVILTAQQAASLYEKADVRIIPTKTVGEGYVALSMLDTGSGDTDAIVEELTEIAHSVVTGMVSVASRDTEKDGLTIRRGDFLGFADDVIYAAEQTPERAVSSLAEKLGAGKYDIAVLICGCDVTAENAQALYDELSKAYRRTEFIMLDGGQPIYDYILILE